MSSKHDLNKYSKDIFNMNFKKKQSNKNVFSNYDLLCFSLLIINGKIICRACFEQTTCSSKANE